MNEEKVWWQSRTIWTGLIGSAFAILSGMKVLPEGLSSDMVVNAVLGVTSVLAVVFRAQATKAIAPVVPTAQ